jgi:DNA polymerase elongation subunit (family B)
MTRPRILTLDIETSPMEVLHFGKLYDVTLRKENIIRPTEMMCFAAKWYGEKKVMYYSTFHNGTDAMLHALWDLLDECDILITYNGKRFDVPHMNRELLEAGFQPPSPYRNVDLYQTVKSQFLFESSSLEFVSQRIAIGAKIKHAGMPLWRGCMRDEEESWTKMRRYNRQDVLLTEKLYTRLRPWVPRHPSLAAYTASGTVAICPACGSDDLRREGYTQTQVSIYQRYRCRACGKWSRGTHRTNVGGTGITEIAA